MSEFFEMILDGIGEMYSLLDRIPVLSGVSVLDFLIAVVVISVVMPVLITLVKSMNSSRNVRVDRHASDSRDDS